MISRVTQPGAPAIGIVSHNALGALLGSTRGHTGGVEWQTSLTARWLAARGYRVSLLTWDEGLADGTLIDGVEVRTICPQHAGVRGVRFVHPRWTGLCRALRAARANVYYQNCGEYVTGQVALWCRRRNLPFVYSVASDPDCDVRLPEMKTRRERVLYRYGLRHADEVIVQTRRQQAALATGFARPAIVIPMPCPGPSSADYAAPRFPAPGTARVVWVARIVALKRLEWLLDIAQHVPGVSFDIVGGCEGDTAYAHALLDRAGHLPNVTLRGWIARECMPAVYRQASCLCCTSAYEGFPNTFLEAFSHGVPVVSTVDPDGVIAARRLGAVAHDVPALVQALRTLVGSETLWYEASRSARRYYLENHAAETVLPQFEQVFLDVIARRRSCRPALSVVQP